MHDYSSESSFFRVILAVPEYSCITFEYSYLPFPRFPKWHAYGVFSRETLALSVLQTPTTSVFGKWHALFRAYSCMHAAAARGKKKNPRAHTRPGVHLFATNILLKNPPTWVSAMTSSIEVEQHAAGISYRAYSVRRDHGERVRVVVLHSLAEILKLARDVDHVAYESSSLVHSIHGDASFRVQLLCRAMGLIFLKIRLDI